MNSILSVCTLVDSMKLTVTRVYVGSLMTSLEMAGVSLTLLKVLPDWEQLLGENHCCRTSLVYSSGCACRFRQSSKKQQFAAQSTQIFLAGSHEVRIHIHIVLFYSM